MTPDPPPSYIDIHAISQEQFMSQLLRTEAEMQKMRDWLKDLEEQNSTLLSLRDAILQWCDMLPQTTVPTDIKDRRSVAHAIRRIIRHHPISQLTKPNK